MISELQPVAAAVVAALLYSLLWFSRQVVDPTVETPKYDPWKLISTLVLGACIGLASAFSGIEVSQASVEVQLTSYGFLVAVIEQVGKAVYRYLTQEE